MKCLLLLALILPAATAGQTLPFSLHNDYLIVTKCSVGDLTGLTAMVDTGVTETVIDLRIARRLNLTATSDTATTLTRDIKVLAVKVPGLQLGVLHTGTLDGISLDLSYVTRELGVRPDLLIGMDVLRQSERILIDYKAKTITFGEFPRMAHSAPLLGEDRMILVTAVIDGTTLRLKIDTGFNALLVYGGKLRVTQSSGYDSRASAGTGEVRAQNVFASVKIGDWTVKQMPVSVTDQQPKGPTGFDGLLGPRLLGIRRMGFDLRNQIVYWE